MKMNIKTSPHHLVKICRICGDRAIAFNFNGMSCESCKSFFRRNCRSLNKFTCIKNETCTVNITTRNACKRCRLLKCFEIGMKKELVLEKSVKKRPSPPSTTTTPSPNSSSNGSGSSQLIDIIWKQIDENYELNSENDCTEKLVANLEVFNQEIDLNPHERQLIAQVNDAISGQFVEELNLQIRGEVATFKDGLNLPGVYIRKIIKFCKQLQPFKILDKEDQLLIVKPYFTELLLTRFTFAYNAQEDSFPVIAVSENENSQFGLWLKVGRLEEVGPELAAFAKIYRQFIINTKREFEGDTTIRNLIATLLLFRPREKLSQPEFMRFHYFVYERLLGRYLEQKYFDVYLAAEKFTRLKLVIEEVAQFRKPISDLYTLVEIQELHDVLTEIYELKCRFDSLTISD